MRPTLPVVLAVLLFASQGDVIREAIKLGQTHDDPLFAAFSKGYELSPSGVIDHAEIITEFRRAVLLVRDRTNHGDYSFGVDDLSKELAPFRGLVTFIAQARLHPLNTFTREPPYDLYVSTGPRSAPIAAKTLTRQSVLPPGLMGPGNPVVGVRLEASFPRAEIERAAAPFLVVTDDKAETLWQARIDLSRYR